MILGLKHFFNSGATIRRIYGILGLLLVMLATPVTGLAETLPDPISVAYCQDCQPFEFINNSGQPDGLIIDYWRLWSEKTGIEVEFHSASWDDTLVMVRDGKVDAHAGLFYNEDRDRYLDYGARLAQTDTHYFLHHSLSMPDTIEGLSPYKIGVLDGDYVEAYLLAKLPTGTVVPFPDYQTLMSALHDGTVLGFAADTSTALFHLQKSGLLANFRYRSNEPLYSNEWFVAVAAGQTELISMINTGLAKITKDERREIENRWVTVGAVGEGDGALIIAVDRNYPPMSMIGLDGQLTGLLVDMWKLWSKTTNTPIRFRPSHWQGTIDALKSKEADIHSGLFESKERSRWIGFSKPIHEVKTAVYYRSAASAAMGLSRLAGRRVGVVAGSSHERYLNEILPTIVTVPGRDTTSLLISLIRGELDALVSEIPTIEADIKRFSLYGKIMRGDVVLMHNNVHAGVLKENQALLERINAGFAAIPTADLVAVDARWLSNPLDRFYRTSEPLPTNDATEQITLTEEERIWLADHPDISVGMMLDWPPFSFVNADKELQGISADFARAIDERIGNAMRFSPGPWPEILKDARERRLDIIFDITPHKSREEFFNFTQRYLTIPHVFVANKNAEFIASADDLQGKSVALEKGFVNIKHFQKNFPDVEIKLYPDTSAALNAVATGLADAYAGNRAVAIYLIEKELILNLKIHGRFTHSTSILTIGVRKDWPILRDILDKALASITNTEKEKITRRWVDATRATSEHELSEVPFVWVVSAAAGIFFLLILLVSVIPRVLSDEDVARYFGSNRPRVIALIIVSVMVVAVAVLVWLTLDNNQKKTMTVTEEKLSVVLVSVKERLQSWALARGNYLIQLGRDPELVNITKHLLTLPPDKDILQGSAPLRDARDFFAKREKEFGRNGFFIISENRVSYGSRRNINLGTKNLIAVQAPNILDKAFGGNSVFIPPIESDLPTKEGAEPPLNMFFAAPIVDEGGTVIGVLAQRLFPEGEFSEIVRHGRVGLSGESYAFNMDGRLLSDSRFTNQLVDIGLLKEGQSSHSRIHIKDPGGNMIKGHRSAIPREQQPLTRMAASAIEMGRNIGSRVPKPRYSRIITDLSGYRDYRGVLVYGAWIWLSDLGFGVTTEIDVDEALAGFLTLRRNLLIISSLTLIMAMSTTLLTVSMGERATRTMRKARDELEIRVAQRTDELAQKEGQLRTALNAMPGGLFMVDKALTLQVFNDRLALYYDLPDGIVQKGGPIEALIRIRAERGEYGPGNPSEQIKSRLAGYLNNDQITYIDQVKERMIEVMRAPTADGGVVATFTDVTERKRSEVALREARDKAEAATRSKAAFLAAMSHEIRTPMNGVVGMISLLQETQLEPDQRSMMTTVHDSAFALLQIINDILDFSKIEAGKMSVESIPVNIDAVMEGVCETLLPNVAKKNLHMALFVDPNIPVHVLTDQVRLRQILFNLAGNATKFTETNADRKGVVTFYAELTEPVRDKRVRIRFSIIDNGIGMKPEVVDRLFTPFTQADQSTTRRFGGTGLGLSIAKNLCVLMGGVIEVESEDGKGSAFHVTLPFEVAEDAEDHIHQFDLSGLNIAYAVTFEDTAEAVDRYAGACGARVTRFQAADLIANVRAVAESDPFDIVVLGKLDDDQDREKVVMALRDNPEIPSPRFVILTSDRSERRGMVLPDKVVVESGPVHKSSFLHGVAMAAGRASPVVEDDIPKLSADARAAPSVEKARDTGELVLVAEDNITNQDVIRRQLNVLGYACEVADDGVIALDMLKSGNYGLLLTDCHMPNMDGYELSGAVRHLEQDGRVRVPIIAITANALHGEADRCLASGMDDYLAKPLEMGKLKAMLRRWLPVDHGTAVKHQDGPQPTAEDPPEVSGSTTVDITALTDMFGQDMDVVKEIFGDFIEPSKGIIDEIDAGVDCHDASAVGKAGHKLKSSSRAIGANALADLCFALETAGNERNWAEIDRLHPDLHPSFDAVVGFIEKF